MTCSENLSLRWTNCRGGGKEGQSRIGSKTLEVERGGHPDRWKCRTSSMEVPQYLDTVLISRYVWRSPQHFIEYMDYKSMLLVQRLPILAQNDASFRYIPMIIARETRGNRSLGSSPSTLTLWLPKFGK